MRLQERGVSLLLLGRHRTHLLGMFRCLPRVSDGNPGYEERQRHFKSTQDNTRRKDGVETRLATVEYP